MAALSVNRVSPNELLPNVNLERIVHTWNLEGKTVNLIQSGVRLEYELIPLFGRPIRGAINLPQGRAIENCIEHLKTLEPSIGADGSVRFNHARQAAQPPIAVPAIRGPIAENQSVRSNLDNQVFLSHDRWAVTLTDNFFCNRKNPATWGGHACLYIESIENGHYLIRKAHLVSGSNAGFISADGNVKMDTLSDFNLSKIKSKTETWSKEKELIQIMLDKIEGEKAKATPIHLDIRGRGAVGVDFFDHNCFTWAKAMLRSAGIFLYSDNPLDGIMFPRIISLPKSLIQPDSIYCKEAVIVEVNFEKIDVTCEIQRQVGDCSWKPISNYPYINASRLNNPPFLLGAYPMEEPVFQVPQTMISIHVNGQGPKQIDVSQVIQKKLAKVVYENEMKEYQRKEEYNQMGRDLSQINQSNCSIQRIESITNDLMIRDLSSQIEALDRMINTELVEDEMRRDFIEYKKQLESDLIKRSQCTII